MTETADKLRHRADELAAAGARVFDGPAHGFVLALLDRAAALSGAAAEYLIGRAARRLAQHEQHFLDERDAAEQQLQQLEHTGVDLHAAQELLERGDFGALRRAGRSRSAIGSSRRRAPRLTPTVDPGDAARKPRTLEALRAARDRAAKRAAAGIPSARYRNRRAVLSTALRLATTQREVPKVHGPYNGQTVSLELLEMLAELSPIYAHTTLERTRELAALAALPTTQPPPKQR